MTKKIFESIIVVAGTILLASLIIIMGFLYNYFENVRENGLKEELELTVAAVEDGGIRYLEKMKSDRPRITWIDKDGTVLYDTITGKKNKENHLEREEVKSAFKTGEGKSNRYSNTLFEKTIYYAKRMEDGTVLRISISSATVGLLFLGMLQPILIVVVFALVLSGMLASRLAKRIVQPLNDLDLEEPLDNDTYEEISPLLNRINRQKIEIQRQFKELQQREAEFTQITACMNEGLVLMDKKGTILNINPAANKIFSLNEDGEGKDFLAIYRDHEMSLCMKAAAESGHSEIQQSRFGREYQFDVSRIESEGEVVGSVLLIFDVTEKILAERNRREFTANISHELKTPLQGIIGSAELIENGMVNQQDIPRFLGHIRKEASRLVALVSDIIRLSQLDENTELTKENVDLMKIAEEVFHSLDTLAKEKKIDMRINGGKINDDNHHVEIYGVKRLFYDIIYNLCDNAMKYNIDGGKMDLGITKCQHNIVLSVSDTGIGIPNEHIDRIFERFYRVDKSHSKETGGTGLGLSIVKHAVAYHHGTIHVESEIGKGTEVRVELPL